MSKNTETYHKLITAAAACFAEKGFNATSVREIAIRAGISQGAMYTYFASKDALIAAIVLEEQNSALLAHQQAYQGTHLERLCHQLAACISDVGYPVTHQLWVEIMAESSRNKALQQAFIDSDASKLSQYYQRRYCGGGVPTGSRYQRDDHFIICLNRWFDSAQSD